MTPQTPRTTLAALLAALLLLPLLAACGGAAPSVTTAPAAVDRPAAPAPAVPGGAAAPTVAPAATAAPALEAVPAAAVADTGGAPRPPVEAISPNQTQQMTAFRAGEVDDNQGFEAYLAYLATYRGPAALSVDVRERYEIHVVSQDQLPVLDARVRLYDGQALVFEGRTYAGGRTVVFPRALGISDNSGELRLTIEKGNSRAEGVLRRGQDVVQTFTLSGAAPLAAPRRLDVLFLLDATGSMSDEIGRLQETIAEIAARIDRIEPRPELRLALVAYRDRGDAYVTRTYADFTGDVGAFREALLQVRADGGGDTPEDLNEGLRVALQELSWADDAVRLTFLVADAPPHLDYGQQFSYTHAARAAVERGVKIYPIAASNTDPQAEYVFRQLAQQTLARFIFLTYEQGQSGGAPGNTTQMNVDPSQFTVERLDDLVVDVVERELAEALGVR